MESSQSPVKAGMETWDQLKSPALQAAENGEQGMLQRQSPSPGKHGRGGRRRKEEMLRERVQKRQGKEEGDQ